MPLAPRSVAGFYGDVLAALHDLGIEVSLSTMPSEIPDPLPFDLDTAPRPWDREPVQRWWRIQLRIEQVLQRFRSDFVGKSSPVQFFWGSFDLTTTRFSGRPAEPPAGVPRFVQLSEDQENHACGFWPGNTNMAGFTLGEPAFYAYLYPEPAGFRDIDAGGASYHPTLGEFVFPYDTMRRSPDPDQALLTFCRRTYERGAELARWDRTLLER